MLTLLTVLVVAAVLPGSIELLVVTLGGLLPARKPAGGPGQGPDLTAVVPAHDEEDGIEACVESLFASDPQMPVVVVADNCTDDTASRARSAGARVLERFDDEHRGKGFALDHAFRILLEEDVEAVVVVDADTLVDVGFAPSMRAWLRSGADAVQCRYGVLNAGDSLRTRLMNVALLAFNVLRPRGRAALGASAGIYGNGFALTAETLREVPYDATSVVEDLEYHLRLVRAGRLVRFADDTEVRALMPTGGKGVETQRSRWEGGRMRMLRERAPGLLGEVLRGRLRLLEPLLELMLLPLAMHVTLLLALVGIPDATARWVGAIGLGTVVLHVFSALVVGRASRADVLALLAAPFYIAWKIGRVPAILAASRGNTSWVRTERETDRTSS